MQKTLYNYVQFAFKSKVEIIYNVVPTGYLGINIYYTYIFVEQINYK